MKTWHIHISGLVQGVGFRPHVYKIARQYGIAGQVSNALDGVHIRFNAFATTAQSFLEHVIQKAPKHAVIREYRMEEEPFRSLTGFHIIADTEPREADLLLTPDYALCETCREELTEKNNRRYRYAFTTCLQCGPRYSIIRELPYEREHTTLSDLAMCPACKKEYWDPLCRRHFSQTNSCPHCTIPMHWYDGRGQQLSGDPLQILEEVKRELQAGKILAVKGVGGYLLLCDATNENAIHRLRSRKHRPAKPFALLYRDTEQVRQDVVLGEEEEALLKDSAGPILLCRLLPEPKTGICTEAIAPGLDKIGLMLPSAPLLQLIAADAGKPLVATSANISGSPIIYEDDAALGQLGAIADLILTYDREIVVPQDDSVMQLTEQGTPIILRRSRGLAPNYYPHPFETTAETILAMGAELKSAFALQHKHHLYISQYLGNQESLASQEAFQHTLEHFYDLLHTRPSLLLCDMHPGYSVSQEALRLSNEANLPLVKVQHHEAHFAAVLAENNLLHTNERILGIIWDGTGYGNDGQVWGGECFLLEEGEMHRVAQLDYFPQLLGDKMSREPRLSALSLLKNRPAYYKRLEKDFSEKEWSYYLQLLKQPAPLLTSSMGRFLDGIAAILGICTVNSFEGEAAMKLEALARQCTEAIIDYYPIPLQKNRLDHSRLLDELFTDLDQGISPAFIARKLFRSLAVCIRQVSDRLEADAIACSGGVFQNALLNDLISEEMRDKKIYRHQRLSPNDECIGFGQLAWYHLFHRPAPSASAAARPKTKSHVLSHTR